MRFAWNCRGFLFLDMAQNKKAVLLYCDLIHTIEKMDNETAGLFFKHYLRYVNDLNPKTDNLIVDLTFESVKQNLKRDLKKWEQRAERSRENGAKGGRPAKPVETQKTQRVILEPKKPVTDTVTVKVTDTVKVNDINDREANFKNEILLYQNSYSLKILEAFFLYWSEPDKSRKKMRFEKEKTWDTSRRLSRWAKNDFSKSGNENSLKSSVLESVEKLKKEML